MSSVYVRLALYVLTPLLTAFAAAIPGWGVGFSDGVVSINIEALAGAVVTAFGLSGAIFAKWGVK